jgi:hypothetical protein
LAGGLAEIFGRCHRVAVGFDVLADIDTDDVGAFSGEADGVCPALSAGSSGDEDDFIVQV